MMSPASAMSYVAQAQLPPTSDDGPTSEAPLNLSTGSRRTRSPPRSPLSPTAAFIYATTAAAARAANAASPTSQAFREPPGDPYLQALPPHYHHPFPLNGQSAVELLQQVARKTQQRQAEGKGT